MAETETFVNVSETSNMLQMSMLSSYVLLFLILMTFFWVVFFSFNFSFLRRQCRKNIAQVLVTEQHSDKMPDGGRCFVASIVTALVVIGIYWAFKKW